MNDRNSERVLALDMRPRRFGFVAFEGPTMLLDCGVKTFHASTVKVSPATKIRALLDDYSPAVIVVRERERHHDRARILQSVQRIGREVEIPVRFVSREEIARVFVSAAQNKHGFASALAEQFLTLAARLPPRRKIWQSEDYRTSMFDAAAAGMGYFARRKPIPNTTSHTVHLVRNPST